MAPSFVPLAYDAPDRIDTGAETLFQQPSDRCAVHSLDGPAFMTKRCEQMRCRAPRLAAGQWTIIAHEHLATSAHEFVRRGEARDTGADHAHFDGVGKQSGPQMRNWSGHIPN